MIKEKREVSRLTANLDHYLKQLNENAPIQQQLKVDYDTLRAEMNKLNYEITTITNAKDRATRANTESKARASSLELENRNLNQDCKDLAKQVQVLLSDLESSESNAEIINDSHRVLQNSTKNITETPNDSTDAHDIISERLVIFHNSQELQIQNQKMRRSLRSLSKQLEEKSNQNSQLHSQEIDLAKEALIELQEQVRIQALKCESFLRERDQWKRVAETRGPLNQKSSPSNDIDLQSSIDAESRYQSLHKQLQNDFDAYRKEIGIDSKVIKEELDRTRNERNLGSVQIAKLSTQLEYQQERYQSVISSQDAQFKEHAELRDRMTRLANTITRQDSKAQELTNKLIESKDEYEVVRTEARQLRIEKEIVKQSEIRLITENKSLVLDRNRNQELIKDLQRMQDDSEINHFETIRKLEVRIDKDEKEL